MSRRVLERVPALIVAVLIGWSPAWALEITIPLELRAVPVDVCGGSFQELEVSADPRVIVHYAAASARKTPFTFSLPESFQVSTYAGTDPGDTVLVQLNVSTTAPLDPARMVLPDIPGIMDGDPQRTGPSYCELVARAAQAYPKLRAKAKSSLVKLRVGGTKTAVRAKKRPLPAAAPVQSVAVLDPIGPPPPPRPPLTITYLIITQDLYRPEADQLAGFRDLRGEVSQVINVSDLPGYDATEPTPSECEVGSSRVDLQACKLEYSIVSPK